MTHVCSKCSPEHPCFFSEGEIVALTEPTENEMAPWTGMVLEVERDQSGRVYRVLWGPPPVDLGTSAAVAARHSGAHRAEELQRFLVPPMSPESELRGPSGGGREGMAHRFGRLPAP